MYIIDYLKDKAIFLKVKARKKRDFIRKLIELAVKNGIIAESEKEDIFTQIMARERQQTTAVGNCIAIPHSKSDVVSHGIIVAATCPEGIKFDSMDGKPVRIVFMFVFPPSENKEYLQVLAKVSRLLKDEVIRNRLILSESIAEFRDIIAKNDVIPIEKSKRGAYIFILALSDQKKIPLVISDLVEIGAQTSLLLDSETLEKKLAYDIPIFAGLSYFKGKTPFSKTFIGILNSSEQVNYLNQLLIKDDIDLSKPGAGFLLTIEAHKIIGGIPEEIEV